MPFSVLFIIRKVTYSGNLVFPKLNHENELARLSISARSFSEVKTHINNLRAKYAGNDAEIRVRTTHGMPPKQLSKWLKDNKNSLLLRSHTTEEPVAR